MTDPADPTGPDGRDATRDWQRVRRLVRLHGLYWAFGAMLAALYHAGLVAGAARTVLGLAAYVAWGLLLVLTMRIVARPRRIEGGLHYVSGRTFLVLVAFLASLAAYIGLLELIGMKTIELL